ncbi:MAG: hypothetical protein K9M49_01350 [Candidatus Marinimicrobia bacterium]|nr:hypothetical protein [Candidatus Neomarinimicrobiota bacterium]
MRIDRAYIIMVCFLCVLSCEEQPPETEPPYRYPLALGNFWVYDHTQSNFRYSDSASSTLFDDTTVVKAILTVTVSFQGLWGDSMEYCVLNGSSCLEGCDEHSSWHYYTQNDTGLLLFGYKSSVNLAIPKGAHPARYKWGGQSFNSRDELLSLTAPSFLAWVPARDTITLEDPMVKALEYPIYEGANWTYRDSGSPWRMEREVLYTEDVLVDGDSFSAYVIRTHFDRDHDGTQDNDVYIVDHFTRAGLARRKIFIDSVLVFTPQGLPTGQYIQIEDLYELDRVKIN